jgi:hypothetical protein
MTLGGALVFVFTCPVNMLIFYRVKSQDGGKLYGLLIKDNI